MSQRPLQFASFIFSHVFIERSKNVNKFVKAIKKYIGSMLFVGQWQKSPPRVTKIWSLWH